MNSVKQASTTSGVQHGPGSRLSGRRMKALTTVVICALVSAGLTWTATVQGFSAWSFVGLFLLIGGSTVTWQWVKSHLGSWTAFAVVCLGWAALTFTGAVTGVLCGGQACPTSEVAAYTLVGALTPVTALLLATPTLVVAWGVRALYRSKVRPALASRRAPATATPNTTVQRTNPKKTPESEGPARTRRRRSQ